ncbi:hypothetical protein [Actinomadura sp. RB99]|nr:hypothetical protein [Actinomadura sp. RB99]
MAKPQFDLAGDAAVAPVTPATAPIPYLLTVVGLASTSARESL